MSSPAHDIAELLTGSDTPSSIVLTMGADLFVNVEPNLPHLIVTVFDTIGDTREMRQDIFHPSVMIRVKAMPGDYESGYQLIADVMEYLHGLNNVIIDSMRYIQIVASSDINAIGRDENNRPIFSANFRIMRTNSI